MRVLMLNPFLWPYRGGTEKHVWEVARRITHEHPVTILTARLKVTKQEDTVEDVRIVRTPTWLLKDVPKPLPPPVPIMPRHSEDLRKLCRHNELIHGHNRFYYGLEPANVARRMKKKIAWTLHNPRPEGVDLATDFWGQAFDETIGKTLLSQCNAVLGVSENVLRESLPQKFQGFTGVAYNGVDTQAFHPHESPIRKGWGFERTVLCVARFVPQKGLEFLVDAMKGLKATLILVGRGPEEKNL
ncbi:MAG TPA: glycosyltransferase family 4 protein, partial [Candidatus Norongarragalinales archaeon]|nr:glycosyltransferase family 4 protein [Candidatus Norongarragalinales archaeon]